MNNSLNIRDITPQDTDELVSLYNSAWPDVCYDKRAKLSFVLSTPNGINICATINEQIVGSRTSLSMNMHYHDTPLKCIQYTDSCVSKEFRGHGIFKQLNEVSFERFFNNGDLIFNVSEESSKTSHERLGWKYIETFSSLFKINNISSTLIKLNFNIKKLSNKRVWDPAPNTHTTIPQQLISMRDKLLNNRLHIKYNDTTIEWRLSSQSGIKIFSCEYGYLFYKIGHLDNTTLRIALIGEMLLYDYSKTAIKHILNSFIHAYQIDILQTYITIGHPLYPLYIGYGFKHNPKHKFINLGYRTTNKELAFACQSPTNWALCTMDLDTF